MAANSQELQYDPELQNNTVRILEGANQNVKRISLTLGKGTNLSGAIENTKIAVSRLADNFTCSSSSTEPNKLSL